MIQRRDASRSDSHQYFPVCDRWFRKIDQLQLFITIKLFRSHCAHMLCPFLCGFLFVSLSGLASETNVVVQFDGVKPCFDVLPGLAEFPDISGKKLERFRVAVRSTFFHESRPGFDFPANVCMFFFMFATEPIGLTSTSVPLFSNIEQLDYLVKL
jgi:hypothetical protein